jgi:hypothetical protein
MACEGGYEEALQDGDSFRATSVQQVAAAPRADEPTPSDGCAYTSRLTIGFDDPTT